MESSDPDGRLYAERLGLPGLSMPIALLVLAAVAVAAAVATAMLKLLEG